MKQKLKKSPKPVKRIKPPAGEKSQDQKKRFNQLLDDAIFGVKKK